MRGSRFNVTFRKCEELDGWHAVFGKTVYGFDVLKEISEVRAPLILHIPPLRSEGGEDA